MFNCILNTVFLHAKRFSNGLFEILQVGAKQEKHKTENAKSGTSGHPDLSLAGDRTWQQAQLWIVSCIVLISFQFFRLFILLILFIYWQENMEFYDIDSSLKFSSKS